MKRINFVVLILSLVLFAGCSIGPKDIGPKDIVGTKEIYCSTSDDCAVIWNTCRCAYEVYSKGAVLDLPACALDCGDLSKDSSPSTVDCINNKCVITQ